MKARAFPTMLNTQFIFLYDFMLRLELQPFILVGRFSLLCVLLKDPCFVVMLETISSFAQLLLCHGLYYIFDKNPLIYSQLVPSVIFRLVLAAALCTSFAHPQKITIHTALSSRDELNAL